MVQNVTADDAKGFFKAFLDFSLSNFIATRIVKVLYGIILLGSVLVVLVGWYGAIMNFISSYGSATQGLIGLVLAPISGVLFLIVGRMYCELFVVAFRIAEYLEEIRDSLRKE